MSRDCRKRSHLALQAVAHDHQLRALLKQHLATRTERADLIVDELVLAYDAARADIAVVNGRLEGFEIKASSDTLVRLPRQVEAYDRVFEFSWVVTTKEHLAGVRNLVPKRWGLMVVLSDGVAGLVRPVRGAKRNKNRDPDHLARLLWRDELLSKLQSLGLSEGLKRQPKVVLYGALAAAMSADELADYVCLCLRTRENWPSLRVATSTEADSATSTSPIEGDLLPE